MKRRSRSEPAILAIFTAPKPFQGTVGRSQERAIQSWRQLGGGCEVFLVGDEEGIADAAHEYGVQHLPNVERNEYGTPLVSSIFSQAACAASAPVLCYVNADIILSDDFVRAVTSIPFARFLMVGRRWDVDPQHIPNLSLPGWQQQLRGVVATHGQLQGPSAIDYFVHSRDLWQTMPPFAIGRARWDNWTIYNARASGAPVVDATAVVQAVHQNHDYSHHPQGKGGVWRGVEAQRNRELAGGDRRIFTTDDASYLLTPSGLMKPPLTADRFYRHLETYPVLHPSLSLPYMAARAIFAPHQVPRNIAHALRRSRK